jgi:pyridoxine 5-phosphate synthase
MRLSINIDHIATLRNARGGSDPDPVMAAAIVEDAGADGIVCHLREDRRHIRDDDVKRLRKSIRTKLDLEMAATPEIIAFAGKIKPDLATLVPEKRKELTTEGGLDAVRLRKPLRQAVRKLQDAGIAVSLFIDPVRDQIEAARETGSEMIEIHTGEYANARTPAQHKRLAARIQKMAAFGKSLGFVVNAGHGLDYANVGKIAAIPEIEEMSIGHAVIVHAVIGGLANAVREMVSLVKDY